MNQMNKKNNFIYPILVIIVLFVSLGLIISFSYAFKTPTFVSPPKVDVDILEVSMDDGGKGVTISDMYPTSDEQINSIESYQFTIRNNSEKKYTYQLLLEELPLSIINDGCTSQTLLNRSQLRYQLIMNDKELITEDLDEIKLNVLDSIEIDSFEKQAFSLRIFVPKSAENTEWQKKHYHYRVKMELLNKKEK